MARSISEAAGDRKTKVAEVIRSGEKITIPDNMTIDDSIRVLQAKLKEEEQVVSLVEDIDVFISEGLFALSKVLNDKYGWYAQLATPGMFGPKPPALIGVEIAYGVTVQVPWGRFSIPGIKEEDGFFQTGVHVPTGGMMSFRLQAELKKKHSRQFHELCAAIRNQLGNHSLYKGKAVTVKFTDKEGARLEMPKPEFTKISAMKEDEVIFSDDVQASIKANLYTVIEKTALVRKQGIPLRRGVLLAGPYGVGKTSVANLTSQKAVANGWTYVYCQKAIEFPDVVKFAQQYQPAVVFCEDIDRVTDGDRSAQMDSILNTIDGVDSKNSEIILVLTSNEMEKIHPSMLRPGRLDAVINVKRPDGKAVQRLLRSYAGVLLPAGTDLTQIGAALAGNTPAVIREVVERSKLAAISLFTGETEDIQLSEEAFLISARTMDDQLNLLERKQTVAPTAMETLGNIVGNALANAVKLAISKQPTIVVAGKEAKAELQNAEDDEENFPRALNLTASSETGE